MNPTQPTKDQGILFVVPEATMLDTGGKWLLLAAILEKEGFDLTLLVWSDDAERGAKELKLPYTRVLLTPLEVNKNKEAEILWPLIDWSIEGPTSPTWADFLVLDDFLGIASGFKVGGVEALKPRLIILPYSGTENGSQPDEQIRLTIWRWAATNQVPVLGVEVQTIEHTYRIHTAPVKVLAQATSSSTPTWADQQVRWYPAHQYCFSHGKDVMVEEFLLNEQGLRESVRGGGPTNRWLLIPFHLYYLAEHVQMLQALLPHWKPLQSMGYQLLFSCGGTFRRALTEKDIILQALGRWLKGFGDFKIIEQGAVLTLALLSDACLLPYPHSLARRLKTWGVPVLEGNWAEGIQGLPKWEHPTTTVKRILKEGSWNPKHSA